MVNCHKARKLLTAGRAAGAARRHVEECADCRRFARHLASVERALGEHHAGVGPPIGFAARLQTRLGREDDILGWAALRLLPATLGLVLLLSWLNLREPADRAVTATADPAEAVLTWVLDPSTELESGLGSGS